MGIKQPLTQHTPNRFPLHLNPESHIQPASQCCSEPQRPVQQQQTVCESQLAQEHSAGLGGDLRGAEQQQSPHAEHADDKQGESSSVGEQQHRHQLQQQEPSQQASMA